MTPGLSNVDTPAACSLSINFCVSWIGILSSLNNVLFEIFRCSYLRLKHRIASALLNGKCSQEHLNYLLGILRKGNYRSQIHLSDSFGGGANVQCNWV